MGLGDTIKENKVSNNHRAWILIFIHYDLDESLKNEYLTVKELVVLWKNFERKI